MKRIAIFLLLLTASMLVAERPPAVKPRVQAQDYPAVQQQSTFTLGAAQLSAKQVRKTFVSNIGKNYVVVEVAVYPKADTSIAPQSFTLREADSQETISPADPQLMASRINEKNQKGTNYDIYPVETVTYTTGSAPDDPYYNNGGKTSGVNHSTGVMVDMNSKKKNPKTSAADQKAMTAELSEKSLPAVETAKPVAGFLYFPVSSAKHSAYQLEYQSPQGTVILPLPAPAE
jgi:hypothetical protein